MDKLSEYEKKVITFILDNAYYKEQGALFFQDILVLLGYGSKEKFIIFEYEEYKLKNFIVAIDKTKLSKDEIRQELLHVLSLINLISYLEEKRYLIILSAMVDVKTKKLGTLSNYSGVEENQENYTLHTFGERKIPDYRDALIVPTEKLIYLKKNNFISEEEKRHRQNIVLASVAISVSLIIGITSAIINIL